MTDPDPTRFAERLIQAEPGTEALRQRYEQARQALVERRLNALQRGMGFLSLPVTAVVLIGLARRWFEPGHPQPREWLALELVSALGLLAMALWMLPALIRGRVTRRGDQAMEWIGGLGLAALALAFFAVADSLDDPRAALRLQGVVTLLLVGGAFAICLERTRRLQRELRLTQLTLELHQAEHPTPAA